MSGGEEVFIIGKNFLKDTKVIQDAGYPNVEFMITKGYGHRKIYRENKVLKRILDFL